MKNWKFVGKRQFTLGRWYHTGDVIESESKPNSLFEEVKEKSKKYKEGD